MTYDQYLNIFCIIKPIVDEVNARDFSDLNLNVRELEIHRINVIREQSGVAWVGSAAGEPPTLIIEDNEKFVLAKLEYG